MDEDIYLTFIQCPSVLWETGSLRTVDTQIYQMLKPWQ